MLSPRILEESSSVRKNLRLAALEYGIVENRFVTVKGCIDEGVDVNATTHFTGVRPLDLAVERRNVSILRLLLRSGADAERKDTQGSTALINASRYGYLDCVMLLVEQGASFYNRDVDEKTCLQVALEKRHCSVATFLLRRDASERVGRLKDGLCLLQHLILTDDAATISNLKYCDVYLDTLCPDGTLLVFFALQHCKNEALKGLLQARADPNIQDAGRGSALSEAVEQNNVDAVRLLIAHGADYHLKDKRNRSPIGRAVFHRALPMVTLLLGSGVDTEQDLGFDGTPLTYACSVGNLEVVQQLVERGANLNAHTADGRKCLLVALECGHQSIVDYLLNKNNCEVNGTGRDGFTALHHAILLNNTDWMRKLLQKQADVNSENHEGEVPVFLAAKHGKTEFLHMLLEAGADPNIDTKDGDLALHEAVKQRDIEAVKVLLQHGANRDKLDKNRKKAVEVAAALVPLPEHIINCLLTDYMDKRNRRASHSIGRSVGGSRRIFDSEAEQSLYCPITLQTMIEPVIAADGHTYERTAIKRWILEKGTSPVTRQRLTSSTLVPNLSIKHLVEQFENMDSSP